MKRRYDWAFQMHSVIDTHKDKSFEWGKNDCCLFASRVVDAMCDSSFEEELKKKYHDEQSAMDYINSSNGIKTAIESHLGIASNGRPKRGDVVLFENEGREILGICTGTKIISMATNGLAEVDRSTIVCFWEI